MNLAVWPRWASPKDSVDNEPFPGWPIQISQLENYGRSVAGTLPPLGVTGKEVVKIFNENSGELVYAICPEEGTFEPFVFDVSTTYRIEKWLKGELKDSREQITVD